MEDQQLLHKYLNGEASKEEIQELKRSSTFASYVKIATATEAFETPVHDANTNLNTILNQIQTPAKRSKNWMQVGLKIAAVFAIIIAGIAYFNSLQTTITTEIAEHKLISLPNNSEVRLNANSKVAYDKNSWNEARTISLEGEAFFKVTKGSTFEVLTPKGTVKVLGTQFNIFARDDVFNVQCFEGLVEVHFAGERIQLAAGQQLLSERGSITSQSTTSMQKPGWISKESNFENAMLVTVLREIEHQYDTDLSWPAEIEQRRFTGSFTHTHLENALQSVCIPLQLTFTIKEDQVTIYDGEEH